MIHVVVVVRMDGRTPRSCARLSLNFVCFLSFTISKKHVFTLNEALS